MYLDTYGYQTVIKMSEHSHSGWMLILRACTASTTQVVSMSDSMPCSGIFTDLKVSSILPYIVHEDIRFRKMPISLAPFDLTI